MPEFVGQTRTLLFSGTVDNDCDNLSSADPHLYIEKPSVIIGGYQGTYTQCLSHQPCHFDISDITIDGEDYDIFTGTAVMKVMFQDHNCINHILI